MLHLRPVEGLKFLLSLSEQLMHVLKESCSTDPFEIETDQLTKALCFESASSASSFFSRLAFVVSETRVISSSSSAETGDEGIFELGRTLCCCSRPVLLDCYLDRIDWRLRLKLTTMHQYKHNFIICINLFRDPTARVCTRMNIRKWESFKSNCRLAETRPISGFDPISSDGSLCWRVRRGGVINLSGLLQGILFPLSTNKR